MCQSGAEQQGRRVDRATRHNECACPHAHRVFCTCLWFGSRRLDHAGSTVLDNQPVSATARDNARITTIRLCVVQECHQRALLSAMPATEYAESTLVWIARTRVALDGPQPMAKRFPTAR